VAEFRQKLIDLYLKPTPDPIDDEIEEIEDFTSDDDSECIAKFNTGFVCERHTKKQKILAPASEESEGSNESLGLYYEFEKMDDQEFIDLGLCYQSDLDFIKY
jgi:hypothetical protein